ncbi:MAG TPA: glycine zipper 2TM domain-containing protein [Croceibacterium sp.]|nr:glycine zipper 2TM domain-containing protein [Croceibacterium sp.]
MMTLFKTSALAIAAGGMALTAVPASALDFNAPGYSSASHEDSWDRSRRDRHRDHDRYGRDRRGYDEPVYRNTRVWRGNDGRTYCRKKDGTTGLIIGGAAGALLGREVDSRGDRTLGTVLGAAAGALIGKSLDDGVRCR